jgi:hypothetical protein
MHLEVRPNPGRWSAREGPGTLIDVVKSRDERRGRRVRAFLRAWLCLAAVACLQLAAGEVAHARIAPTPVKPTPVKPTGSAPAARTKPPVTPTEPPPPAPPAKPAAGSGTADPSANTTANTRQSEIYGDRLDTLQTDVDNLKDKVFRSKARLALLKETVLRGVMAGSRIIVAHRNLMGSGFRLVRVVYILDGAQIYARTDETGSLDSEDEVVIYDGNLPPGPHNVTVELTYQGHGFGVFSYLSGYTFESRSSHSFDAPENGALKLASIGFERGNITTEMKDRPSVSWQEIGLDASGRPLPTSRKKTKKTQ